MSATLRIHDAELRVITSEILRNPHRETGGSLYGLWSVGGSPTVLLATRPGPSAVHREEFFRQDAQTHMALERLLWTRLGLQCVGLWHSHHHIGLPTLSPGDVARTRHYARSSRRERYAELLGFFQDEVVTLRPYVYDAASLARNLPARVEVMPGHSPVRSTVQALAQDEVFGDSLVAARLPDGARYELVPSARHHLPPAARSGAELALERLEPLLHELLPTALRDRSTLEAQEGRRVLLTVQEDRVVVRISADGSRRLARGAPSEAARRDVRAVLHQALGHLEHPSVPGASP